MMVDHRRLATSTKAIQASAGAAISVGESRGSVRHDQPSPLPFKPTIVDGKWVLRPAPACDAYYFAKRNTSAEKVRVAIQQSEAGK